MKTLSIATSGLIALAVAGSLATAKTALADDSTTSVNDSVIQTQQMDYLIRNGGYVLRQDTYSASVGGRNSTMISPAPRFYAPIVVAPSYYTAPAPGTYMVR